MRFSMPILVTLIIVGAIVVLALTGNIGADLTLGGK